MNADTHAVPDGHKRNPQGHLVPIELIADIDLARDDLVQEIVGKAKVLQDSMVGFKTATMNDIAAFVQLSAEQYSAEIGGEKGNVTLTSFDGRYRVVRSIAQHLAFDERLQAAKELVDRCIRAWAAGADPKIRALVEHAFQTDKTGQVNTGRVLTLTRLKIDDPDWQAAMEAIRDSMQVANSKAYVRIYERIGHSDQWRAIALDIAAL